MMLGMQIIQIAYLAFSASEVTCRAAPNIPSAEGTPPCSLGSHYAGVNCALLICLVSSLGRKMSSGVSSAMPQQSSTSLSRMNPMIFKINS